MFHLVTADQRLDEIQNAHGNHIGTMAALLFEIVIFSGLWFSTIRSSILALFLGFSGLVLELW